MTEGFRVEAQIRRWVDGDTVDVIALSRATLWPDQTLDSERSMRLRLAIVDTPERGQPGFKEATIRAAMLVPVGAWVTVYLYDQDSLTRWLADVLVPGRGTTTVTSVLLAEGLGVIWK